MVWRIDIYGRVWCGNVGSCPVRFGKVWYGMSDRDRGVMFCLAAVCFMVVVCSLIGGV